MMVVRSGCTGVHIAIAAVSWIHGAIYICNDDLEGMHARSNLLESISLCLTELELSVRNSILD